MVRIIISRFIDKKLIYLLRYYQKSSYSTHSSFKTIEINIIKLKNSKKKKKIVVIYFKIKNMCFQ